jgi:hypothetical protein
MEQGEYGTPLVSTCGAQAMGGIGADAEENGVAAAAFMHSSREVTQLRDLAGSKAMIAIGKDGAFGPFEDINRRERSARLHVLRIFLDNAWVEFAARLRPLIELDFA